MFGMPEAATTFPPAPFATPCDWAQDGLRRALEGMGTATTGVSEYHIGSRGLKYVSAAQQIGSVGWWAELVKYYCGVDALPTSLTGRDTAFRVIPRDV